ncbi:MAG: DUF89 family protein [Proteobacteria bacterium]|nr:DUF89 family protein [Pseudomonadota bacterium]MBU1716366.1 DUF89 family protein [Pseudomonadota bacterium]
MQTAASCLDCFKLQIDYTTRLAASTPEKQASIIAQASKLLAGVDPTISPPENAVRIYRKIAELTGCIDPFARLKKISNELALGMRPEISQLIGSAQDPLYTALKLAIAGNVIDYGAHHDFEIERIVAESLAREPVINDYRQLRQDIAQAASILYLGDNCGELVFDGALIEQIGKEKKITLAVKENPIINDALISDAIACGLDHLCEVISNGTDCPGTPLDHCNETFQEKFRQSDLIISKGQGNFETLSETKGPIYFLLTVKCKVVATHLAQLSNQPADTINLGDLIIMKNRAPQRHFQQGG